MTDSTAPTCTVEGCDRPQHLRRWCVRHYKRWLRHGSPTAGRSLREPKTNPICRIAWCDRPTHTKGLCRPCWNYTQRHREEPPRPNPYGARTAADIIDIVLAIEPGANGCRDSTGIFSLSGDGYPRVEASRKRITVTRLVLEQNLGRPLGEGMIACHTCDNPPCVEPTHLWEGTPGDNMSDRDRKLRHAFGERNAGHKLGDREVLNVRSLYATGKYSQASIARAYGVSRSTIHLIVTGKKWRHLL